MESKIRSSVRKTHFFFMAFLSAVLLLALMAVGLTIQTSAAAIAVNTIPGDVAPVVPNPTASTADFVITVKTDNSGSSSSTEIKIPTYSGETDYYNGDCDYGGSDGI